MPLAEAIEDNGPTMNSIYQIVIPLSVKREGYYEKLLTLGELFSRLPRFFLPLGPGPFRR